MHPPNSTIHHELHDWDLPHLKETVLLKPQNLYWLYDAKFYPYTTTGADPIFAITSIKHILVYRICRNGRRDVQLIQRIEDEDRDANNSSLEWSKDLETGAPLICVAGGNAKIKIRDARTGTLRATLLGHGGDINDLAISPMNPGILASASADNTVRIWSLNPTHSRQPCVVLCAGEGHLDTVLSVAFHGTGRYVLSGGQDHVVNLWTLPEVTVGYIETQKPIVVYRPHFSTSEVHSNIVDCVTFYSDLILSKAFNEQCIVLWQITGFDSSSSIPDASSAPSNYDNRRGTRSAFSRISKNSEGRKQYVRLLQFEVPGCVEFYMRFGLYSALSTGASHPTLAICNSRSKVFFWDLSRLEVYYSYTTSAVTHSNPGGLQPIVKPPIWLVPAVSEAKRSDTQQIMESSGFGARTSLSPSPPSAQEVLRTSAEPSARVKGKYATDDPIEMLEAHKVVTIPKLRFDGRQVAWSVCGRWCIVAASRNTIVVLER